MPSCHLSVFSALSSNKAILAAGCFLSLILMWSYYLTDHSCFFTSSPYYQRFAHAPGIQAAPASSSTMKCDASAECQWPLGPRDEGNATMFQSLFLHTECYCVTSMQGLDGKMNGMIILMPKPSGLKLPLPFLLTSWLHYLLIPFLQKCTSRSEKPLKSSTVSPSVLSYSSICFLVSLFLLTLSIVHAHHDQAYLCRTSSLLWGSEEEEVWGRA